MTICWARAGNLVYHAYSLYALFEFWFVTRHVSRHIVETMFISLDIHRHFEFPKVLLNTQEAVALSQHD